MQNYKYNMDAMRTILGGFSKRWQVADVYTQVFDSLTTPWPSTVLLVQNPGSSEDGFRDAPGDLYAT